MRDRTNWSTLLFRLVIVAGAAFVVTILALVAVPFGDPAAPVAQWLDRHGGKLVLGEVVLILVLGFLAMLADRRRTLRQLRSRESARSGPTDQMGQEN
jgi:hypothetical protein